MRIDSLMQTTYSFAYSREVIDYIYTHPSPKTMHSHLVLSFLFFFLHPLHFPFPFLSFKHVNIHIYHGNTTTVELRGGGIIIA